MSDNKQTDAELCQQLQWIADDNFPIGSKVIEKSIDRLEQYRNEVTSVLELLDGLADQWGDEAVFRRCRDRLRELVNGTV
jgi:hypothetical protein